MTWENIYNVKQKNSYKTTDTQKLQFNKNGRVALRKIERNTVIYHYQ